MKRIRTYATAVTLALIAPIALSSVGHPAAAKLKADYRFEGTLRSSVGTVNKLVREGPEGGFLTKRVNGQREGVWRWSKGTGLRLDGAQLAVGPGPGTYTFVMLVRLNAVDGYRKLIHFKDLAEDDGFYVYDGTLYPYDLDYSAPVILPLTWYQIVLTRDAGDVVRVYVDGTKVLQVQDPEGSQVLGPDDFLRFVRDDEGTEDEEVGGMIARLRIYSHTLTSKEVRKLTD